MILCGVIAMKKLLLGLSVLSLAACNITDDQRSRLRDFARAQGVGAPAPSGSITYQLTSSWVDGQYRICVYGNGAKTDVVSRGLRCPRYM